MSTQFRYLQRDIGARTALFVIIALAVLLVAGAVTIIFVVPRPSDDDKGDHAITVTDATGRTVTVNAPIGRMVITGKSYGPLNTLVFMFPEARDVVYGINGSLASSRLFKIMDPNIAKKVDSVMDVPIPSAEKVAALKPDVVILKPEMKTQLGDPLGAVGIPVVYLNPENITNFKRDVRILGALFENSERAQEILDYYDEKLILVQTATSSLGASADRPSILVLYYTNKGGTVAFNVPGPAWLQTEMTRLCAASSLSDELTGSGWNIVSLEQIAQWDPDVVFIVTYSNNPSPQSVRDTVTNDTLWQGVEAVKGSRVYAVPNDLEDGTATGSWDCPGSRFILGLLWMCAVIHPGTATAALGPHAEAVGFYKDIYGASDAQASELADLAFGVG